MSKPVVFIPDPIKQVGLDALASHCRCVAPWLQGDEPGEIPKDAEAVLVRGYRVDGARMDSAPRLRVVAKHGVGFDNIDVEAATARGLPVLWTPDANADAVAQHTLAVMLLMANRLRVAEEALRGGRFGERLEFGGLELQGRTLGIVGIGRIGSRVARRAKAALNMEVLAYDPYVDDSVPATLVGDLHELLARSFVVTLHVPLTDDTRGFINEASLAHMQLGAFLINTSRGPVIDEPALVRALHEGSLGGAAIDVYASEPPSPDHPLLTAPNVVLTPHVAGLSDQALVRVATQSAEGIIDVLQGRAPASAVNSEALDL